MISLTRRYHFAASHRLHVASLSAPENRELFGKCNNPFGHGHDYTLSVTVSGDLDETTGLLLQQDSLDQLVEAKVLCLLAHRNLNTDVPRFVEVVPTTENLALFVADLLVEAWAGWFGEDHNAYLVKVHVQETDRNGFEVRLDSRHSKMALVRRQESITVNG